MLTRDKKHWLTTDFGKSWRDFTVPVEPALVGAPLSFHADKYGHIMYQGTKCDGFSGGCSDEVRTPRSK